MSEDRVERALRREPPYNVDETLRAVIEAEMRFREARRIVCARTAEATQLLAIVDSGIEAARPSWASTRDEFYRRPIEMECTSALSKWAKAEVARRHALGEQQAAQDYLHDVRSALFKAG